MTIVAYPCSCAQANAASVSARPAPDPDIRKARRPAEERGAFGSRKTAVHRAVLHGNELEARDQAAVRSYTNSPSGIVGDIVGEHRAELVLVLVGVDAAEDGGACLVIGDQRRELDQRLDVAVLCPPYAGRPRALVHLRDAVRLLRAETQPKPRFQLGLERRYQGVVARAAFVDPALREKPSRSRTSSGSSTA